VTRKLYILCAALLASAALAVAQPAGGYALRDGEAELSTTSLGQLEIGMPVRGRADGSTGTVIKFIRRDVGGRAADLAVVQWEAAEQQPEPLAALEPIDAGTSLRVAQR
jgi:hypothetical protein